MLTLSNPQHGSRCGQPILPWSPRDFDRCPLGLTSCTVLPRESGINIITILRSQRSSRLGCEGEREGGREREREREREGKGTYVERCWRVLRHQPSSGTKMAIESAPVSSLLLSMYVQGPPDPRLTRLGGYHGGYHKGRDQRIPKLPKRRRLPDSEIVGRNIHVACI